MNSQIIEMSLFWAFWFGLLVYVLGSMIMWRPVKRAGGVIVLIAALIDGLTTGDWLNLITLALIALVLELTGRIVDACRKDGEAVATEFARSVYW